MKTGLENPVPSPFFDANQSRTKEVYSIKRFDDYKNL